jgi:hypothetical protein
MNDFDEKETSLFNKKMFPCAVEVYQSIWPGSTVRDMRGEPLDKHYGIDLHWILPSGQYITVQEKYRKHKFLTDRTLKTSPPSPDFTQGYTRAVGTKNQSPGEWFKLAAQFYFYGWADDSERSFEQWVILDVLKYKLLIEEAGGFEEMKNRRECVWLENHEHGLTGFWALPILRLKRAFVYSHLDNIAIDEQIELEDAYRRFREQKVDQP